MNTLTERGFTNAGSLDHSSFTAWMNRPLARVNVTIFQYALKVFKDDLSMRFHCLPPFRGEPANSQRKAICDRLREMRRETGRMKLWKYDMQTGNYVNFNESPNPKSTHETTQ